ncbi:MAG: hypothetical protein AB7Q37_12805 [Pyrinomonadaceae bacterium]
MKETVNGTQTWREVFGYDRYDNQTGHDKFIRTTEVTQTDETHPAIAPGSAQMQCGRACPTERRPLTRSPSEAEPPSKKKKKQHPTVRQA